ncbi:MAG: hypothetical protein V4732_08105 [Pseudomonadota bacterium]
MNRLAKGQLSAVIVKCLPQAYILSVDHEGENSFVFSWMNRNGTSTVITLNFEQIVVDEIQNAIERHDNNLERSYLEQIENALWRMAIVHDYSGTRPWNITREVFTNDLAQGRL